MGVTLCGANDRDESMNHATWAGLLKIAYRHGWKPLGVQDGDVFPEAAPIEPSDYVSNSFQIVTDEDAFGMALALSRALEEPNEENQWFTGHPEGAHSFIDFLRSGWFFIC